MTKKEKNHHIIGKCFMRVIKNHKLYTIFEGGCKNLLKSSGEHLKNANSIMDVFDYLAKIANNDYNNHRRMENDKYEPTTFIINTYLRNIIENEMHKKGQKLDLCMIGQEIFDLSCYRIFGDEFLEDMEKAKEEDDFRPQNALDGFIMSIYQDYMKKNLSQITFEEFYSMYGEHLKNIFEKMHGM